MIPIAIAVGIIAGNLMFDVGINTLQNWYDTVYADSFWSNRVQESPALRDLAREEAEIDRLMNDDVVSAPAPESK